MMKFASIAIVGSAVVTAGCTETLVVDATGIDVPQTAIYQSPVGGTDRVVSPGEELMGRVLRVETPTTTNRFVFLENGVFRIEDASGTRVVQGTYQVRENDVCVDWAPRGGECWPNLMAVTKTPASITSDRGQTIEATLIDS